MQEIVANRFHQGLDGDTNNSIKDPTHYISAHNVTLSSGSDYLALTNIKGTSQIGSLSGTISTIIDCNVRIVPTKYKIGSVEAVNCLTVFIVAKESGHDALYINCYDLDNNVLYYLFKDQSLPSGYFSSDTVVDTRVYPENGIDYVYFEDNYNEGRQLRCEIPTGSAAFFLTDFDISLQRWGANGKVSLLSIDTGTLLTGTYQYAYRCVDPTHKRFTRWSTLSQPFHVYSKVNDDKPVYSAPGLPSPFALTVIVSPSPDEVDHFDYFQLAVIENVYGVDNPVQTAALLPITSLTSANTQYVHKSNDRVGLVAIQDIVIDPAAIRSSKTLAVKQNRLFRGNIKYHDLQFDNGTPAVDGGNIEVSTVVSTQNDIYSDGYYSSKFKGYFRDETYRFGIVYKDKYGNKGPVSVLDLNSLTGNQITGSLPDVHFPARSTSNAYTIFSSTDQLRALGITLSNIHNHPTWAVGFEIVRAKRIKRILFQTPVIPMMYIEGIGALDSYPSLAVTQDDGVEGDKSYPDAQPQKSLRTYTPKNLFWPELRNIQRKLTQTGSGASLGKKGEAALALDDDNKFSFSMIYPQSTMYGDTPYKFTGSEKLETIDYTLNKTSIVDFDDTSHPITGNYIKTRVSGVWYALKDANYFFDSGWSAKSITTTPTTIKNYQFVESLSEPITFNGNSFFDYDSLNGQGVNWGYKQQVQKGVVIETSEAFEELNRTASVTFAAGVYNVRADGGYIVGSSGPKYPMSDSISNAFINEYPDYSNTLPTQAFRIVNAVNNYGDDRYGSVDTPHEFISTGASYTFTSGELVDVKAGNRVDVDITVFGGDCFLSSHVFKVSDTQYSVINQAKNYAPPSAESSSDLLTNWDGRYYLNQGGAAISLPIALEGASQFVQCVLESEYNGGVMAEDNIMGISVGGVDYPEGGFPIMNHNKFFVSAGAIRSPLTYLYNINISKQDDQRVYFARPAFNFEQSNYKARVMYSDVKIYGSDTQGFDIFRVGNIYDLEENGGGITKLALEGDNLYAIQNNRIVYLPTGKTSVELTDANILAIGAGDVISRPLVIDSKRGGQQLQSIIETGNTIFIPDPLNDSIYALSGQQLKWLEENGMRTNARSLSNNLLALYDSSRKEYWLVDNNQGIAYVFSEQLNLWIGDLETSGSGNKLGDGVYDDALYIVSKNGSSVVLHKMYAGNYNQIFGVTKTPRVTFVVNPDPELAKTFDDQAFVSTGRLGSVDYLVQLNGQTSTASLDISDVEGNFRIKIPRDSGSARLRGTRLLTTVNWKTGTTDTATLTTVLTKYRKSSRTPF